MKIRKDLLLLNAILLISLFIIIPPLFSQEKTITLDVENMNIETALKMIAEQSGLNVAISKNVVGNITVKLENVSVDKALDAVLRINNYLYSIENGIITVYAYQDLQQKERFIGLQTRVFTLVYADVVDLKRVLLSMKTHRGKIEINAKNNQVVVTDTPEKVKEIEKALKELDQKTEIRTYKLLYSKAKDIETKLLQIIPKEKGDVYVDGRTNIVIVKATSVILDDIDTLIVGWDVQHRQVLIEAKILEVTLDETTKLGIEWEHKDADSPHNPSLIDIASKFPVSLTTGGIFKIGSLTPDEYAITLEALKSKADTEVLSSPRVVVIDNQEASILVGSSEPYTVATTDPITKLLVEDVKYVEVGIKLNVTPQIGEDNYVTMKIHPEVSTARRVAEVKNVVARDTTEADTTMMVKDGETIILGGLIKDSKKKTVNKVPLLGDIPIVGLAFRSKTTEDVKKEIIVFITPHILTNETRQTVSRQEYKAAMDRTGTTHPLIEESIEESSGGVEILPPMKEEKAAAIRREILRILDMEKE